MKNNLAGQKVESPLEHPGSQTIDLMISTHCRASIITSEPHQTHITVNTVSYSGGKSPSSDHTHDSRHLKLPPKQRRLCAMKEKSSSCANFFVDDEAS